MEEAHFASRGETRPVPVTEAIIATVGEYDTGFEGVRSISEGDALLIEAVAKKLGKDPVEFAKDFRAVFLKNGGYATLFPAGNVKATLKKMEQQATGS